MKPIHTPLGGAKHGSDKEDPSPLATVQMSFRKDNHQQEKPECMISNFGATIGQTNGFQEY